MMMMMMMDSGGENGINRNFGSHSDLTSIRPTGLSGTVLVQRTSLTDRQTDTVVVTIGETTRLKKCCTDSVEFSGNFF